MSAVRLLPRLREKRVGAGPLGNGAWLRIHDRFARSVHRYQSVIAVIPSRPVRSELTEIADEFVECLAVVRTACERAQLVATGTPGASEPLVRRTTFFLSPVALQALEAKEAGDEEAPPE